MVVAMEAVVPLAATATVDMATRATVVVVVVVVLVVVV